MDFLSRMSKKERRERQERWRSRSEQNRCCSSSWNRVSKYDEVKHDICDMARQIGPNTYVRLSHSGHPTCIDFDSKMAAVRVSSSIVSIISYSGEEEFFWSSGTIIECNYNGLKEIYDCTILTSASALRYENENVIANELKIDVITEGGKLYQGNIVAFDFHYNIAMVEIESDSSLPVAKLRPIDYCIDLNPHTSKREQFQLARHSDLFKIRPGDKLITLGRYFTGSYELMAICGNLSVGHCYPDCKELFRLNCKISRLGIGGPIINCYGDVIGITFYPHEYTPFLPINLVVKWWEHIKGGREFCPPLHGMTVTTLGATSTDFLLHFCQKFANVHDGVFVEEVIPQSPAAFAGIFPNDVIVQCDNKSVRNLLEFFEMMLEKAGKSVKLDVLRAIDGTQYQFTMLVAKTEPDKYNRWRIPKLAKITISGSGSTAATTILSER